MNKNNVAMNNGLGLEGYVDIDIVNEKNHTRRRIHNTITKAGKQLLLHKCVGQMMQSGASLFGKISCLNTLTPTGKQLTSSLIASSSSNTYTTPGHISDSNQEITCGLLNLGTAQNNLTESSSFIPSYSADGKLENLTGFSNNNVNTSLSNEGLVDICKGEYCADAYTVCNRWKYDAGIASGTIDTLVMAPASILKTNRGTGFRFMKCIDKVNIQDESFVSCSTGILPPGVSGYTASNEILLNYNDGTGSRWKYNIDTGEISAVADEDNFYVIEFKRNSYEILDWYVDGTYLYELRYNNNYVYVYVQDLSNNGADVTSFRTSYNYTRAGRFFVFNSTIYVSLLKNGYNTQSDYLYPLTKSGSYVTGFGSSITYESIGITIPNEFKEYDICIGMKGTSYVLEYNFDLDDKLSTGSSYDYGNDNWWNYIKARSGIVFTSLTNIIGTMSDKISMITRGSLYCNKGIVQIGMAFSDSGNTPNYDDGYISSNSLTDIDASGGSWAVSNNRNNNSSNVKSKLLYLNNIGAWISLDGWWSDILSFVKLGTPIEKGDTDVLYVSYGYKVVV